MDFFQLIQLVKSISTGNISEQEQRFRRKFYTTTTFSEQLDNKTKCNICSKLLNQAVYEHPTLGILICRDCREQFETTDLDTSQCGWCRKRTEKDCFKDCTKCPLTFCFKCIKSGLGCEILREIRSKKEWACFSCDPEFLWRHRAICAAKIFINKGENMPIERPNSAPPKVCPENSPTSEDYAKLSDSLHDVIKDLHFCNTEMVFKVGTYIKANKFQTMKTLEESRVVYKQISDFIDCVTKNYEVFKDNLKRQAFKWEENFHLQLNTTEIPTETSVTRKRHNSIKEEACTEDPALAVINENVAEQAKPKKRKFDFRLKRTDADDSNVGDDSKIHLGGEFEIPLVDDSDAPSVNNSNVPASGGDSHILLSDDSDTALGDDLFNTSVNSSSGVITTEVEIFGSPQEKETPLQNKPNDQHRSDSDDAQSFVFDLSSPDHSSTNYAIYDNEWGEDSFDDEEPINLQEEEIDSEIDSELEDKDDIKKEFFLKVLNLQPIEDFLKKQKENEAVEQAYADLLSDDEVLISDETDESYDEHSTSSFDDISEPNIPIPKEPPGKVVNMPIALNEYFTLVKKWALKSPSKDESPTGDKEEFNVIPEDYGCEPCEVRLLQVQFPGKEQSQFRDKELRDIKRLINLNTLENVKRTKVGNTSSGSDIVVRKRRKVIPSILSKSDSNGSDSDVSITSVAADDISNIIPAVDPTHDPDDYLANIIQDGIGFSDDSTDLIDSNSDSSQIKKKQKKIRQEREKAENERKAGQSKASKWKNDPLLHGNETSTDQDDDFVNDAKEPKKKLLTVQERDKRSSKKLEVDDSDTTFSPPESVKEKLSKEASSDSSEDSDVEFIREMTKSSKSICISSDEGSKKSGRKNIRAVLADETLDEATKIANKEEEERKRRLTERIKSRDSMVSQHLISPEEGLVLEFDEITNETLIMVHPVLSKRLKTHQQNGVRFMWDVCYESVKRLQHDSGTGCILAHCMGLGKTFQVIVLLHTLFTHKVTNTKSVLVVCPLSTVPNWNKEFDIALNKLDSDTIINRFLITGSLKSLVQRAAVIFDWQKNGGVLIMGYEAFQRFIQTPKKGENNSLFKKVRTALLNPGPDLVVCDEGHLIRNGKNMRAQALNQIKTRRRIMLTGTPMQNNLQEYYYMVQFAKPNLLGTYQEFNNRFNNPITNGQYDDSTNNDIYVMKKRSHVLHKILETTVQRYEVSEFKNYLPAQHDYVLFVQVHPVQAKLYKHYLQSLGPCDDKVKRRLFSDFHNLHYIWSHPRMLYLRDIRRSHPNKQPQEVDVVNLDPVQKVMEVLPKGWYKSLCPEDYETNIEYGSKFQVMLALIEKAEDIQDKILVFSSSIAALDTAEYFLKTIGTKLCKRWTVGTDYCRMDGTVTPELRMDLCDKFNSPNKPRLRVFLISSKVGGLGLNLTAANRVILMDVNWNPAYDSQSVFRIYRFGQQKECYIYRLVSMGTMEECVYERSVTKLAVAGRVIDEMQITRHYKINDLAKMYRFAINLDQERGKFNLPADSLLASVIVRLKNVFRFHEHQALLENLPHEELNEEDMRVAWDEYNKENEKKIGPPVFKSFLPPSHQTVNNNKTGLTAVENQNLQLSNMPVPPKSIHPKKWKPNLLNKPVTIGNGTVKEVEINNILNCVTNNQQDNQTENVTPGVSANGKQLNQTLANLMPLGVQQNNVSRQNPIRNPPILHPNFSYVNALKYRSQAPMQGNLPHNARGINRTGRYPPEGSDWQSRSRPQLIEFDAYIRNSITGTMAVVQNAEGPTENEKLLTELAGNKDITLSRLEMSENGQNSARGGANQSSLLIRRDPRLASGEQSTNINNNSDVIEID